MKQKFLSSTGLRCKYLGAAIIKMEVSGLSVWHPECLLMSMLQIQNEVQVFMLWSVRHLLFIWNDPLKFEQHFFFVAANSLIGEAIPLEM